MSRGYLASKSMVKRSPVGENKMRLKALDVRVEHVSEPEAAGRSASLDPLPVGAVGRRSLPLRHAAYFDEVERRSDKLSFVIR
jgi:hypothetical protein